MKTALLALTLLPLSAQAAPKPHAALKSQAAPKSQAALQPATQITVTTESGGAGGRNAGGSISWTLKSGGAVTRETSLTPAQSMDAGDTAIPKVHGTINQWDFQQLAKAILATHILEEKAPSYDGIEGFTQIDTVRGGQHKIVTIPDSTDPSPAFTAAWTALHLVQSVVEPVDWKDPAGHSIDTGLQGNYGSVDADADCPPFDVFIAGGKRVGMVRRSNDSSSFQLVLPPGTYKLVAADAKDWVATPSTVKVSAGKMTEVIIQTGKK